MRHNIVISLSIAGLVVTSSMALHYRNRVAAIEGKLREVSAAAATVTPPVRYAAPIVEDRFDEPWPDEPDVAPPAPARGDYPEPLQAGAEIPAPTPGELPARRRPEDPAALWRRAGDWISALKTNDPERYEAIQKRRQETKEKTEAAYAEATNWFLYRDTWNMTDADVEEYSRMISLLQETRALNLRLQAGLPREDRRQTMSAVRSNLVVLAPLLNNERDRELYDLSVAMGQNPTSALSTVSYVNQIVSNTSLRVIFPDLTQGRRMGGGPPGAGAPPGPRP